MDGGEGREVSCLAMLKVVAILRFPYLESKLEVVKLLCV